MMATNSAPLKSQAHLDALENEAIYIIREAAAQFERPVLLFSAGKDSTVMLHMARKAFAPGPVPFPLLHIDTGFKFTEMYEYRDKIAGLPGMNLLVYTNEMAKAQKANPFDLGTRRCCDFLKTKALLDALAYYKFDAALGGARREEERSRAKERIFSFRDTFGQWEPKRQRPELWGLYNGRIRPNESVRVFPLSDWTELDVWRYIAREGIEVVPLYFARERQVVRRAGMLIELNGDIPLLSGEKVETVSCRFRTLGCVACTSAVESSAATIPEIIEELMQSISSERAARAIDHDSDSSMEMKKREGYF